MMDMFNEQRSSTKDDELWHAQVITIIVIISFIFSKNIWESLKAFWSMSKTKKKKTCWQCLQFCFLWYICTRKNHLMYEDLLLEATYHSNHRSIVRLIAGSNWKDCISVFSLFLFFLKKMQNNYQQKKISLFLVSSREINQSTWQVAFLYAYIHMQNNKPLFFFFFTCLSFKWKKEQLNF
jgi:hypothetical protein